LVATSRRAEKQFFNMGKYGKKIGLFFLSLIIVMTKTVLLVPRGTCRFYPSCSEYAKEALATMPFMHACVLVSRRLLKCTPFSSGGFDPVPEVKGKARKL
jgi:putative membrane protein insertion efficiency factor